MITKTAKNIEDYLVTNGPTGVSSLAGHFGVSRQALHRQVLKLVEKGAIVKYGRPPKVLYQIKESPVLGYSASTVGKAEAKIINVNYLFITPAGQKLSGMDGFVAWCQKNGLDVSATATQYAATLKKFNPYKKNGLVDGLPKLKNTFPEIFLDKVFYLDFYSIERFGKTRLGQLLLYAKQSQQRDLIKELVDEIQPQIKEVIKRFKIQAIGFVPPTVKREVQFMKELQKRLDINLPILNLVKIKTPVAVPQKSLSKLQDRVENAKATIFVEGAGSFDNILLIDDAIGSGATMNEVAKKIREQGIANSQITGLAITGSFKGFDVISEV